MWRRLEPYLYSRRNIAGTVLGLGGLALFFTGVTGGAVWLPIVVGLYAIGVLVVPGERGLDLRLDAGADAAHVRDGLNQLLMSIRGRVADDIYARVSHIRDAIILTLPDGHAAVDPTDPNLFLIRQTALAYLPQALSAYLAIPRLYAERRTVAGGRTPHDVLMDQLALMDSKMQEVADDVARHDSDQLLAHGRFLAERFAPNSLQLTDESVVAATPPVVETHATEIPAPDVVPDEQRERVH